MHRAHDPITQVVGFFVGVKASRQMPRELSD
jgi:hypothetical protein